LPVWTVGQDFVDFGLLYREIRGAAAGEGQCEDDVAELLVKEQRILDILSGGGSVAEY